MTTSQSSRRRHSSAKNSGVRAVGVHGENPAPARKLKALPVGVAVAGKALPDQARAGPLGDLDGSVGGAAIDDQKLKTWNQVANRLEPPKELSQSPPPR